MSLIFEALEKLEQEKKETVLPSKKEAGSDKEREFSRGKKKHTVIYWFGGIVFFLLAIGLVYFIFNIQRNGRKDYPVVHPIISSSTPHVSAPAALSSTRKQGQFSLTGVTQMGTDKTAIINNQLVRVGDWVSGAKVLSIEDQEVKLEFKGQVLTLRLY